MLKNLNFLNTLASSSLIRFHVQIKHYFGHEHISQHFHAISIFESSCLPSFVTSTATYILGDNLHFKTFELKISSQSKDTVLARIHNLEIEVRVLHGFDRTVTWTFQAFEKPTAFLRYLFILTTPQDVITMSTIIVRKGFKNVTKECWQRTYQKTTITLFQKSAKNLQ